MNKYIIFCFFLMVLLSCKKTKSEHRIIQDTPKNALVTDTLKKVIKKSTKKIKDALASKGFQTFDYFDEKTKDTILMQKYFMVFLKNGIIRSQNEEEATILQKEHLAHLSNMHTLGYADISGSFEDKGVIQGVTIYNVPNLKMADSLAKADPMVKAGRLVVEVHPWWAPKGFSLR